MTTWMVPFIFTHYWWSLSISYDYSGGLSQFHSLLVVPLTQLVFLTYSWVVYRSQLVPCSTCCYCWITLLDNKWCWCKFQLMGSLPFSTCSLLYLLLLLNHSTGQLVVLVWISTWLHLHSSAVTVDRRSQGAPHWMRRKTSQNLSVTPSVKTMMTYCKTRSISVQLNLVNLAIWFRMLN